ncbi:hypothetical protein AOL_s00007g466 [Orbilia oligospora ATCC 24927]|uniref:Ribosomal RNA-processing protein 15 n=2 Tax=Orbilia oligospora TaxID=2813651 RepID=G1X2F7_ARTOA|nr:hypothetical protein AOL_s00007g466 [Orbilia oligospora ATCC 24927]EGX52683.1 hypothetical protein AOL_s00007g466 [Orbilia oligospora ATCC 24927]KAF3280889.1 hypothetical protein TWF970_002569 [Orbilia oligospora]
MSIPATKKRKLEGAATSSAKLTKSIPLKSSLKASASKPNPTKKDRQPAPASSDEEDEEEISNNEDSGDEDEEFSDDNDGDVSDANNHSDSSSYDLSDDEGGNGETDEFPSELVESKKRKRNDPTTFATSMSKILSSHLTTQARKDPILIRSKKAAHDISDQKLEAKAKRLISQQKREALEKGRVKDIIPKDDATGEEVKNVLEKEKALRKIAQRGVIKLFNAVRAAQVKGEEARKDGKLKGTLGIDTKNKNVTEISKESFLDMISKSKEK